MLKSEKNYYLPKVFYFQLLLTSFFYKPYEHDEMHLLCCIKTSVARVIVF